MLKNGRIYVGSTYTLTMQFRNEDDELFDPASVGFKLTDGYGTVKANYLYGTDSALERLSLGSFRVDVVPDSAGRWFFRWATTSPVFVDQGNFVVQASVFERGNCGDYT